MPRSWLEGGSKPADQVAREDAQTLLNYMFRNMLEMHREQMGMFVKPPKEYGATSISEAVRGKRKAKLPPYDPALDKDVIERDAIDDLLSGIKR